MAVEIKSILENIATISTTIDENVFIKSAREAFKTGINAYEISDEEKAKLIAQYEANVSVGVITQIINLAKEFPEIQTRVALQSEQKTTQEEFTRKTKYEIQEVKARTSKNYGYEIEEENNKIKSTDKKNGMIDKQIISEMWRHRDLKAGVIIKNKSVYSTLAGAKFEEARRVIALKANQDNLYLKKAEHKVAQLNAMAMDDDYVITAEQIADVKETIDEISAAELTYESIVEGQFDEVETADISL